ncbi:MAG: hypothetical protein ABIQ73_10075 [Acidimicrobiales bacterium]
MRRQRVPEFVDDRQSARPLPKAILASHVDQLLVDVYVFEIHTRNLDATKPKVRHREHDQPISSVWNRLDQLRDLLSAEATRQRSRQPSPRKAGGEIVHDVSPMDEPTGEWAQLRGVRLARRWPETG